MNERKLAVEQWDKQKIRLTLRLQMPCLRVRLHACVCCLSSLLCSPGRLSGCLWGEVPAPQDFATITPSLLGSCDVSGVECPTPTNCTQMSCKDNYYDEDGGLAAAERSDARAWVEISRRRAVVENRRVQLRREMGWESQKAMTRPGNISNGCEVLCPNVHNAVCKRCQDSL